MRRRVHIDHCRGEPCDHPGTQHNDERMALDPEQPKDLIPHSSHWRQTGKLVK